MTTQNLKKLRRQREFSHLSNSNVRVLSIITLLGVGGRCSFESSDEKPVEPPASRLRGEEESELSVLARLTSEERTTYLPHLAKDTLCRELG